MTFRRYGMSSSAGAKAVHFDEDSMWIDLSDGRTLGVPLAWFPSLLHGSAEQRGQVEISSRGLHWEALDEDISIAGLLAGRGDRTRPQTAMMAARTMATGTSPGTLKVMEGMKDYLVVGKRERPVEEQVGMHEERVSIERRPLDRAVTAADAAGAFQDPTLRARAALEKTVVGKDVRVIEEIGLKKASDRTETVRDTVRKTEVDVEDTAASVRSSTSTTPGSTNVQGNTSSTNSTAGATTSGMNAPRK